MFKNKKIVIAGGTGFIGRAMAERWIQYNEIIVLSRGTKDNSNNYYGDNDFDNKIKIVNWDAKTLGSWISDLESTDILINLAGKSVNCRYTDKNKQLIMSSRVDATHVLGEAVNQLVNPPKLWINGASATIYRHAKDIPQDEYNGEIRDDFSVQVCKAWEYAFNEVKVNSTRKVVLRLAIVFGDNGVLVPYKNLVKFGLGGKQGNGEQMFSWVHIDDVCNVVEWVYNNSDAEGIYNVSSPCPVKNKVLMKELRDRMNMPLGLPASKWMLQLGAKVIGTETELILKSRWVLPTRLQNEGYEFEYKTINQALCDLV